MKISTRGGKPEPAQSGNAETGVWMNSRDVRKVCRDAPYFLTVDLSADEQLHSSWSSKPHRLHRKSFAKAAESSISPWPCADKTLGNRIPYNASTAIATKAFSMWPNRQFTIAQPMKNAQTIAVIRMTFTRLI
jgi:hypothetical protein